MEKVNNKVSRREGFFFILQEYFGHLPSVMMMETTLWRHTVFPGSIHGCHSLTVSKLPSPVVMSQIFMWAQVNVYHFATV